MTNCCATNSSPVLAGHETTLTLTFTFYLLANHPAALTRLEAEIDSVLAGRAPTAQDVPRLVYADCVVKEALRLYPPAWSVGREALKDCEIGGYPIAKGSQILIAQWAVHRDPRWFTNPEAFRPERWEYDLARRLPRDAYFPFGDGPRVCIGNHFATMEAVLLLSTIVQRFHLTLIPGQTLQRSVDHHTAQGRGQRTVAPRGPEARSTARNKRGIAVTPLPTSRRLCRLAAQARIISPHEGQRSCAPGQARAIAGCSAGDSMDKSGSGLTYVREMVCGVSVNGSRPAHLAIGHRQSILIGAVAEFPLEDFRRHVFERSGPAMKLQGGSRQRRQPEVSQLDDFAEEEHVAGLDVAMLNGDAPAVDDVLAVVEKIERVGGLGQVVVNLVGRDRRPIFGLVGFHRSRFPGSSMSTTI